MRRRSRTQRVLKRIATAISVLSLGLFAVSLGWNIHRQNQRHLLEGLRHGGVFLSWGPERIGDTFWRVYSCDCPRQWWPPIRLEKGYVFVPVWTILTVTLVPTAFLWWRDRGFPPGHCQTCGYNLTGNVSGRCPECGERISA